MPFLGMVSRHLFLKCFKSVSKLAMDIFPPDLPLRFDQIIDCSTLCSSLDSCITKYCLFTAVKEQSFKYTVISMPKRGIDVIVMSIMPNDIDLYLCIQF